MLPKPAGAQGGVVDLATYVDVMPNAVISNAAPLAQYRGASSKDGGNLRFNVLQEWRIRTASRFWKSGRIKPRSTSMKKS
jgi:hypothetical protein